MGLNQALDEILADLPWVENIRLIIGPLASREAVKDALLTRASVLPEWAVGGLDNLAAEILRAAGTRVGRPLSLSSQCDALESIARSPLLTQAVPGLCSHLRSRPVATKIARFITQLDRFYVHDGELTALLEYFDERDRSLGAFARVLAELWQRGELLPWGEGSALRGAISALDQVAAGALPRTIWLWGFFEFSPLEEAFLTKLAAAGVEVRLLVPPTLVDGFEPGCSAMGAQALALESPRPAVSHWEAHSVWDELEFLREELAGLRGRGVAWSEIAVYVPADELYKRFCRNKLDQWRVPVQDPTLPGAWRDVPRWLWWRDLFSIVSKGLKADDVRAWLGPGPGREALFELVYERGVHGGASQWEAILAKLEEPDQVPALKLAVEATGILGRAMKPADFLAAIQKLVTRAEALLGLSAAELESELVLDFGHHLCDERPYLSEFRARLPRYLGLFEEFLETKSRTRSLRCRDGVHFIAHGVWLPRPPAYAFVLGLNTIRRPRPSVDVWDWEGLEVRRAWERLHLGVCWAERVEREETFFVHGMQAAQSLVYSTIEHDLSGKPLAKSQLSKKLRGEQPVSRAGGHPAVGWIRANQNLTDTVTAPPVVQRAELASAILQKPLSVSAFEDYLKCPFLYFARHQLGIDEEAELGLDANSLARGTLLHRVLERIISEELKSGAGFTLEQAKKRAQAILSQEMQKTALPGLYRHRPLVQKTADVLRAQVERWLEWEFENRAKHKELRPVAVELPIELELEAGLKLRGKVDRVDGDGSACVVMDYKSGQAPFIGREILDGTGAQLMMYAAGVKAKTGLEPAAGHYLTVGRAVDGKKGFFLKKHQGRLHTTHARNSGLADGEFETLFEKVTQNWNAAAQRLMEGDFSPKPARGERECASCVFGPVCGGQVE